MLHGAVPGMDSVYFHARTPFYHLIMAYNDTLAAV